MNDFNNRISAQRLVLQLVNSQLPNAEELFGLSRKSIDRWKTSNKIRDDSKILELLLEAADTLFFLANKSQEQVTDEYKLISNKYAEIVEKIETELSKKIAEHNPQ